MTKKQYLYSNLFAWGLVLLLITNYVYGWTIPSQNPPGGNIALETGATPAGSTGYIQFNDNGNLGADSNLFWDNTNKYLGVGTANPGAKLEVNGNIITSDPTANNHVVTKSYLDSNFTKVDSVSATNLAVGWYTIAVNSGNRAIARFGLRDTASGRHQSIIFYASHHYGSSSEITVLHNGRYGSLTPYKYIRIKEGSTYDGALLQVYLSNSTNNLVAYLLGDNIQDHGWVLKNFIPDGTDPGGVGNFSALTNVAVQVDIEEILNGGMYTSGNIVASAPTADDHVATKAYVDSSSAQLVPCRSKVTGVVSYLSCLSTPQGAMYWDPTQYYSSAYRSVYYGSADQWCKCLGHTSGTYLDRDYTAGTTYIMNSCESKSSTGNGSYTLELAICQG